MTRFVVATLSANDVSGLCTAITVWRSACRIGITLATMLPSTHRGRERSLAWMFRGADSDETDAEKNRRCFHVTS